MSKETIQVVAPPFNGHVNILNEMIKTYREQYDFNLTITGWKNVLYNPHNSALPFTELSKSELNSTDPALWTFERVNELLPEMINIFRKTKPRLVIYDFFSPEAKIAADSLGIPSWCSIPAYIGPYENQDYVAEKLMHPTNLKAIEVLKRKYHVELDPKFIEGLSDGLFIPSEHNLVWSYYPIIRPDFKLNRQDLPYSLVGNLRAERPDENNPKNDKPLVYFSFGTVVMGNLWDRQPEVREQLRKFVHELANRFEKRNIKVVFATQGKEILTEYPANWLVQPYVDQVKILKRAQVFLTHMGNNSFQEAAKSGVPMVGVPFFGDQLQASERMAELGLGINLNRIGHDIDTVKSYDFLSHHFAEEVDQAVAEILTNDKYMDNYRKLKLISDSLHVLFKSQIYLGNIKQFKFEEKQKPTKLFPFKRGDLLYGTEMARSHAEDRANMHSRIHFWKIQPFSEYAENPDDLPGIVDSYRDVISNPEYLKRDLSSEMTKYKQVLESYKTFLNGENDVCKMCLKGLDFFSTLFGVRFLVDYYDPKSNYITTREIMHVLDNRNRFTGNTIFYHEDAQGWREISYDEVSTLITSGLYDISIGIKDDTESKALWKNGVYVSSISPIKIQAVTGALNQLIPGNSIEVHAESPSYKAHEQLISIEETVFETVNRLLSLQKKLAETHTSYGLLIAACNGIKQLDGHWEDVGVVMLMDAKGRTSIAQSKGVVFPEEYVKIAESRGFIHTTVGSVIEEVALLKGDLRKDIKIDPHSYLTDDKISRQDLLQEAIMIALTELDKI
jgi:MGT family glycosyltransferase